MDFDDKYEVIRYDNGLILMAHLVEGTGALYVEPGAVVDLLIRLVDVLTEDEKARFLSRLRSDLPAP